jgi:hypothetical protein
MDSVKAPNLAVITKAHTNKWVALSLDYTKLLGVADTLLKLRESIGKKKAVVMRVLPADVGYAPIIRS